MARIYLASSWRNESQSMAVERLRAAGHQVYDFKNPFYGNKGFAWSELDPNWQNWTAEEYAEVLLTSKRAAQGFTSDYRAMQWADTGVLWLPAGASAHNEIGWLAGRGKRTFVVLNDFKEPELMYLLQDELCANITDLLERL